MPGLMKALFGSKRQRDLRVLRPLVERVNVLDQEYQALTQDQLVAKTAEFRARLAKGETLDSLLCEAFAVVKNGRGGCLAPATMSATSRFRGRWCILTSSSSVALAFTGE